MIMLQQDGFRPARCKLSEARGGGGGGDGVMKEGESNGLEIFISVGLRSVGDVTFKLRAFAHLTQDVFKRKKES